MISPIDVKWISLLVVFVGSMFFGLLPSLLGLGTRFKGDDSVVLSCFLCFGGGILLETSLVHILPEVRENIPSGAELIFVCGFMLMCFFYTIKKWRDKHDFGVATRYEWQGELDESTEVIVTQITNEGWLEVIGDLCEEVFPSFLIFFLIFMLSVHSFLEGLVIAVEPTPGGMLILLLTVCCRRLLMAFSIGSELSAEERPTFEIIPFMFMFTSASVAGITYGTLYQPSHFENLHIPVLQGLAGGALLFIFAYDILPRERGKDLGDLGYFTQFISILLGFGSITAVNQLSYLY